MAVITSAFQGITTPLSDLYTQIHSRGWTVTKLDVKDGAYIASVKNPHGESIEKVGRDPQTALAAALSFIVRREFIRQGAWTQHWADQLEPIAQAYAKAPAFDAQAAGAWAELAADNMARAQALQQQLQVEVVDEPDPYSSPQELWKDVERNKRIKVTRANAEHPLWNEDQVLAHRLVHDVLGHAAAGGDFGWTGENLATAAHMPYLSPAAQAALFSETVGQAAYRNYYRGHGPRKITFLNEFLNPAQEENNPAGHGGEPIGMSLSPGPLPEGRQAAFEPDFGAQHVLNWTPGQDGKGFLHQDGRVQTWPLTQGRMHADVVGNAPGVRFMISPEGIAEVHGGTSHHMKAIQDADPRLQVQQYGQGFEGLWGRVAGLRRDPNAGYSTGIVPPSVNAVNSFGDPLDHMGSKDVAHKLNTSWDKFQTPDGQPDYSRMKQAIINAFRAALLSPKKELRWNAVHYQDMMHIPHDVSDPKVYWDALESARIDHNRRAGVPHPEVAHKAHYEALLDFYRYYNKLHPDMAPSEAKEHADREVLVMQQEIEEKLLSEGKNHEQEILEPKVLKLLDKRLKMIVKDDPARMLYSSALDDETAGQAVPADKYGAFMGRHLTAIAKVSRYVDLLLESALEDVKNHDGAGHHFRQAVLSLNLPHVGPKIVSFVWLLLQPLTSQLATVDTHICDLLGYKQEDVNNNRDYFRLERELQAGRDAAGYSHMPLGQFQWSIWDNKRNGDGMHQDHSMLRPWNPQAHHTIDWKPQINLKNIKGEEYEPPNWWAITEPYRQNEVAKWNIDVAPFYPKNKIPWQDQTLEVPHIASASGDGNADELHISLDVPERIRERIALWLSNVDLTDVEPLDPSEYHITLAFAEHGVDDKTVQSATRRFNYTGLRFEGKKLTKFNNALVVELSNPGFDKWATQLNDWLDEQGVETSRYPGGFKPHITVGYTDRDDVKAKLPPLDFRAGRMNFSTPRPLRETGRPLTASRLSAPWNHFLGPVHNEEQALNAPVGQPKALQQCPNCQAYSYMPLGVCPHCGFAEGDPRMAAVPRGYQPFDQQAHGIHRTMDPNERCYFHPNEPAVANAGFANMCSECLHSYQQAQLNRVPDMRTVDPERLAAMVVPVFPYNITGGPNVGGDPSMRRRNVKPFIYDGTVLHLGDEESHHGQVAQKAGLSHNWMGEYNRGAHVHGLLRDNQVQWYNQPRTPQEQSMILAALGKHSGQPVTSEESLEADPGWGDERNEVLGAKHCPKCGGALTIKGDCRDCGYTPEPHEQVAASESGNSEKNASSSDNSDNVPTIKLGAAESGYFFHTAPAYARESILKHGLNPQLRAKSPWSDLNRTREGFPQGTFLFDHPSHAQDYAHVAGEQTLRRKYNGPNARPWEIEHMKPDEFMDYGLTHDGQGNPMIMAPHDPDDPEPDWNDDEAHDAWQERQYEKEPVPYNHKEHKDMLPQHLQGYDIWKVKLNNHHLMLDPEPLWERDETGNHQFDESRVMTPEKMNEWWQNQWNGEEDIDRSATRFMVTDPVHPSNLSLHDHVPIMHVAHGLAETESPHYFENRLDESNEHAAPEAFHRLPTYQDYLQHQQKWNDYDQHGINPLTSAKDKSAWQTWMDHSPPEEIEPFANYLADHNEADRDNGELDDVPDEQVERWYENWQSDGKPVEASAPDPLITELQAKVDSLAKALASSQKPDPTPENAARRKLIVRRDENGRIASIEEDSN